MEKLQSGAKELGLELTPAQMERFESYYHEMLDWNKRANLTAITGYEEVQLKHFLDSLTVALALPMLQAGKGLRVIDVGTGAGLPGIPLKIVFPRLKLTLLEATSKKAAFLSHIVQGLGLDGVEVVDDRAEAIARQPQYREQFDVVLSRAVAVLPTLVELALPFCAVGGSFIAQKKGAIDDEIDEAGRAIGLLGGSLREVKEVALASLPDERCLVVIDKLSPTPPEYPRRPGIPSKKPLGV